MTLPARTRLASTGAAMWTAGTDGGVFSFGDARFFGAATGRTSLNVGMVPSRSGAGYWLVSADDVVRAFGDATPVSSPQGLARPVVGLATPWAASSGYALVLLEARQSVPSPPVTWPSNGEVALTFDDGPSPYTPLVLAVLAQHGVPATFFDVGEEVASRPDLARAEAQGGHAVEDHSWDHADLTLLAPAAIRDELARTADAIREASGSQPRCFRPPYGTTNATVVGEAAQLGLTQVLWNVDPSDYTRPGAASARR